MQKTAVVWKKNGQTPLDAVLDFKALNPQYDKEKISYAGRLDPMADGLLLLLIGEENKNRDKYLSLSKEYEAEIVLGIETDTYDALGLVEKTPARNVLQREAGGGDRGQRKGEKIDEVLKTFVGKQSQKYPSYSSKTVNGKPLYWWARKDRLSEIVIPERKIEVYKLEIIGKSTVLGIKLKENVVERIKLTRGDFRQDKIIAGWEEFGSKHKDQKFQAIKILVKCSSGTYIRRLVSDFGEKLGCGAFCLSIKRTAIGEFTLPTES